MKKLRKITSLLALTVIMTSCSKNLTESDYSNVGTQEEDSEIIKQEVLSMKMKLEINDYLFIASLEDNSSVKALKELLMDGPVTLNMTDYAGMEKCASLGKNLPQNNVYMNTEAGDIILYQGNTLVIYYDTNSWSLTPIGKIENLDVENLKKALGKGNVDVTISLE